MEDESVKRLMYSNPTSVMAYPTNQIPSLNLGKSPNFELDLQGLAEDNNHMENEPHTFSDDKRLSSASGQHAEQNNASVLNFLGVDESGSSEENCHRDVLSGKDSQSKGNDLTEKKEEVVKTTATTGSARKRKSSKPINYFDFIGRQNSESQRFYPEDGMSSEEEDPMDQFFLETVQQQSNEILESPIQNKGANYKLSMNSNDEDISKTRIITSMDRPFKCNICGETFAKSRELSTHIRTHSQQQLYICSICDENFFFSESLELHMKNHMEGDIDPKFKCCTCNRSFSDPDSLSKHLETHSANYSSNLIGGQISSSSSSSTSLSTQPVDLTTDGSTVIGKSYFDEKAANSKTRYPCSYCELTFVSPSSLKTHVRTHTGEKPFQCSICKMTFSLSNNLLTHMRKHTGERPYKCSVCGRGFCKSSDVTRHMKTHTGDKPFLCSICHKGFSEMSRLKAHMKIHSPTRQFKCDICHRTFSQKNNMQVHMNKCHGAGQTLSATWAEMRKIDENIVSFNNDNTNVKDYLKMHLEKVKKDGDNSDSNTPFEGNSDHCMKKENEMFKQEEGDDYGDSFFTTRAFPHSFIGGSGDNGEEHVQKFTEGDQETDKVLDFSTKRKAQPTVGSLADGQKGINGNFEFDLAAQISLPGGSGTSRAMRGSKKKTEIPKVESYKCSECDKEFRSASALNIHVRTHTGERPFECSMCDWTFSILGNLKAHMKTHSGEKPYRCEVCDKAFTKKCDVKRHLITHTGERNHMCLTCGKTFSQKCVLQTHMLLHSGQKPFKCTECEKAFCQRVQLITHMKMHKGDRPYQCLVCEKRFREKSTYETHTRIHTGEMPFQCTVCGKFFRDKSYLRKHTKKHHEN